MVAATSGMVSSQVQRFPLVVVFGFGRLAVRPHQSILSVERESTFEVELPIDWDLPFVPWMVIPYYSFYLYFPWAAWMGSSDRHRQNGLVFHQRLIASAWVAFIIFLLFPVEIELRSQAYGAEGLFGLMMSALHEADAPYNAWPSIHVLLSILVVFLSDSWRSKTERGRPQGGGHLGVLRPVGGLNGAD